MNDQITIKLLEMQESYINSLELFLFLMVILIFYIVYYLYCILQENRQINSKN